MVKETNRLYGVLDRRLAARPFVAGEAYSIADMAAYPWIVQHDRQRQRLEDFPNIHRWFDEIAARPATISANAIGEAIRASGQPMSEAEKAVLFGQTAACVAQPS